MMHRAVILSIIVQRKKDRQKERGEGETAHGPSDPDDRRT